MRNIYIIYLGLTVLMFSSALHAGDGVYVSDTRRPITDKAYVSGSSSQRQADVDAAIEQYVKQLFLHLFRKDIFEIIERTVKSSDLQLLPQLALLSAQQTVVQSFKQETLSEQLRDLYQSTLEEAKQELRDGVPQSTIQQNVERKIIAGIDPLKYDPYFQFIFEQVLQQALFEQERVLAEMAIQAFTQQINAQQQVLERQIEETYQASILK